MKIFENHKTGNYKREQHCGYCREKGHNRLECPRVDEDWKYWQNFEVPPRTQGWYRSRNYPKYWGEWYTDCMRTKIKQEAKQKAEKSPTPVVRSAPKCGFCGNTGHNRRNCALMQDFIKDCVTANANYRKRVHDYVVKQLGLDVGACISVTIRHGYGSSSKEETKVALVTKINWDKVNVFCAFNGGYNAREQYAQEFSVKALIDGQELDVHVAKAGYGEVTGDKTLDSLLKHDKARWCSHKFAKVLSKSEVPLSDEWPTSYQEAWTFLTKKRSYERLKEDGVVALINEWC